jgi:hypothetical protein
MATNTRPMPRPTCRVSAELAKKPGPRWAAYASPSEQQADDQQAVDDALAGDAGDGLGQADAGHAGAREQERAGQLAEAQRQQQDHEVGDEAAAVQEIAGDAGVGSPVAARTRGSRA